MLSLLQLFCIGHHGHSDTPHPLLHAFWALTLQHRRCCVVVKWYVFHQVFLGVKASQLSSNQHRFACARGSHQHDRPPLLHEPLHKIAHSDGFTCVHQTSLKWEHDECARGSWEKQMHRQMFWSISEEGILLSWWSSPPQAGGSSLISIVRPSYQLILWVESILFLLYQLCLPPCGLSNTFQKLLPLLSLLSLPG